MEWLWNALHVPAGLHWQFDAVLRLIAAALMGGAIGLERESHGRSAGFRTQMLVALGSALVMVTSLYFGHVFGRSGIQSLQVDPARLAYGVMAGVGFLGAGAILQTRAGVRGLTTAASLWVTAAVGLACGFALYVPALATTLMSLLILRLLHFVDRRLPEVANRELRIVLPGRPEEARDRVVQELHRLGISIHGLEVDYDAQQARSTLTFVVRQRSWRDVEELLRLLARVEGVISARLR